MDQKLLQVFFWFKEKADGTIESHVELVQECPGFTETVAKFKDLLVSGEITSWYANCTGLPFQYLIGA